MKTRITHTWLTFLLALGVGAVISGCGGGGNAPDDDTDIVHNGITYGTVTSPYTGKVWLDRNLGAAEVCTSYNDTACYGDYCQWGRNFDGHQDQGSATTNVQATAIDPVGHANFIESNNTYNYDWAQSLDRNGSIREAKWSQTDGSNVCPTGFRVPTKDELEAELLNLGSAEINGTTPSADPRENAFASFLKLPSSGSRSGSSASMNNVGSWGYVWASSVVGADSHYLGWYSADAGWGYGHRASGLSVRCVKN